VAYGTFARWDAGGRVGGGGFSPSAAVGSCGLVPYHAARHLLLPPLPLLLFRHHRGFADFNMAGILLARYAIACLLVYICWYGCAIHPTFCALTCAGGPVTFFAGRPLLHCAALPPAAATLPFSQRPARVGWRSPVVLTSSLRRMEPGARVPF